MSDSYLPARPTPPSEHDVRREDVLYNRREADLGYPGPVYYDQFANPLSGKDQIAKLLDLLYRRKWIVVIGFLIVMAAAVAYTMSLTPQYEATSFVMVDLGKVSVDIARRTTPTEEGDAGFELFARSDRTLSGEIRLLEISDQLVQRVNQRVRQNISTEENGEQEFAIAPRGRVHFVPERGSDNILRFIGRSSDANQAALLSNLYAEEYVGLTKEASKSHANALRESLEEAERVQLEDLTLIEQEINRYKQTGVTNLDAESSRLIQQIATVDIEREDARIEFQVEKAALASLERELEEINPQLAQRIASGVERRLQTLQEQLAEDEDARAKILLENPDLLGRETTALRSIDDRINRLRDEIDSLSVQYVNEVAAAGGLSGSEDGLNYVANLRQQIAEKRVSVNRLEARLGVLDNRINDYRAAMQRLPRQSLELAQLERTRARAEMKYQNTSDQLQAAYLAEESEPGYAQILRRADVPFRSLYPDVPRNLILGGFFGLLVGLALAVVREKIDNRIYQPEQLRSLGFKEIGVVPDMKPLIKKDYKGEATTSLNGLNISTNLISLLDPVASSSEAYRHVRTHIHFGVPGEHINSLLITSPGVSEGKSTTAANLAIVMAQAGRKTLIIDADLRRPNIHRLFGLPLDAGVIENLSDQKYFTPEAWETSIENLSVLTAGSPIVNGNDKQIKGEKEANKTNQSLILNPSEMLGSTRMLELMASLRELFDIIIIDTPPVLVATDAALLSARSDATIVVARSGVTKEGEIGRAIETLESVGAVILGVLLNGFDISMAFGHKYKYQNYTQYGQYSQYGYHG